LFTGVEDVSEGELDDLSDFCEIRWIPDLRRAVSPIRDFRAYYTLRREIRGFELDVVHTHTSKAGALGRFAAHAEGVPRIIHSTHGSIYESDAGIDGVSDMPFLKRVFLLIDRAAGKRAELLTVLSERERKLSVSLRLAAESRILVVPNGVDAAEFAVDDALRREARERMRLGDYFVILSVGRLSSEKGHSVLLEAFARLAELDCASGNTKLVIVGDGPEMLNLKRRAAEIAGVDFDESLVEFGRVSFVGRSSDIRHFLAAADLFVLPSLYEGFGIVLLEAMAAGVPIVASRTGGVPEIIDDGVDGVLVEHGDSDALAAAISPLISDPDSLTRISENAKRKVEKYSLERMLEGYFELYDK
jgi:glycosyltransferase involved in cell wall biosynthesis